MGIEAGSAARAWNSVPPGSGAPKEDLTFTIQLI